MAEDLVLSLSGGDRRSIGQSNEVARAIANNREQFDLVVKAMADPDLLVRMRAADAVEKASRKQPGWLARHKAWLLERVIGIDQQEIQWHLLQMMPRLILSAQEREICRTFAERNLCSLSRIVAAEALSALVALADGDSAASASAIKKVQEALESPHAAIRARARKLMTKRFR